MSDSSTPQGADREEPEAAAEQADAPVALLRAALHHEPTLVGQLALYFEPDDLTHILPGSSCVLGLGAWRRRIEWAAFFLFSIHHWWKQTFFTRF